MLTLTLVLVLFATLAAGGWYGFDKVKGIFAAEDHAGDGNGVPVEVEVREGQSIAEIANELHDQDVVASPQAFVNAAEEVPEAAGIQPGFYALEEEMSGEAAVAAMLDPESRMTGQITIPEGVEHWVVFEELAAATGLPVEDFEELADDPEALGIPDFWLVDSDGDTVDEVSLEGFLFPQTYEFQPDQSAQDILTEMVGHFLSVVEQLGFVDQVEGELDISPYDALKVASISQAEAGIAEDLAKVSRVMYNRLYQEWDGRGPYLQVDVSTRYGIELETGDRRGSTELTQEDFEDADNKYNTHENEGYPPTPINSPGEAALQAAMEPEDGDWVYFVAIEENGESAFSETYDEFCEDNDIAVENGVLERNSCH